MAALVSKPMLSHIDTRAKLTGHIVVIVKLIYFATGKYSVREYAGDSGGRQHWKGLNSAIKIVQPDGS